MIALDVGNTKTAAGLFRDGLLQSVWRFATPRTSVAENIRHTLETALSDAGASLHSSGPLVVASVVPSVTEELHQLRNVTDLYIVDHRTPLSFKIELSRPETVGADRLADLEAAVRKHGAPVLVVDTGTATTVNVVDADRKFLGGSISPGFGLSLDALFDRAARISRVEVFPAERTIGRSTEEALASGTLLGHALMIRALVERMIQELKASAAAVVITGGAAEWLIPHFERPVHHEPTLTLEGLNGIHQNLSRR